MNSASGPQIFCTNNFFLAKGETGVIIAKMLCTIIVIKVIIIHNAIFRYLQDNLLQQNKCVPLKLTASKKKTRTKCTNKIRKK